MKKLRGASTSRRKLRPHSVVKYVPAENVQLGRSSAQVFGVSPSFCAGGAEGRVENSGPGAPEYLYGSIFPGIWSLILALCPMHRFDNDNAIY
jgi:hypothetical protein